MNLLPIHSSRYVPIFRSLKAHLDRSRLPIYELDQTNVSTLNSRIRPFEDAGGFTSDPLFQQNLANPNYLDLSPWTLAHSVIKSEKASPYSWYRSWSQASGFLQQYPELFQWDRNNLRLIDNAINNYVDFVKTGLAARVGQGLAFLFMESLGYHYHLSVGTYLGRNVIGIAPDYIFEDNSNTQVLMEAKGSFARVGSQPAIKGNLSYALDQLAGYSASQIPNITKHYAVGGYLREEGDQHIEPSMIAFVDPDSESANGDIIRDEDFVRRGNYASWFRAMGFWNTAQRLESNKILKEKTTTKLPTFMFAGHRFAFVVNKVIALEESNPLAPFSDQFFWDNLSDLMLYPPNMVWRADEIVMEVTGIEVNILKKIGNVLIKDKSQALLDIPIIKIEPNSTEINNESLIRGSTFADGTFLGELVFSKKKKSPTIKIEDFVL